MPKRQQRFALLKYLSARASRDKRNQRHLYSGKLLRGLLLHVGSLIWRWAFCYNKITKLREGMFMQGFLSRPLCMGQLPYKQVLRVNRALACNIGCNIRGRNWGSRRYLTHVCWGVRPTSSSCVIDLVRRPRSNSLIHLCTGKYEQKAWTGSAHSRIWGSCIERVQIQLRKMEGETFHTCLECFFAFTGNLCSFQKEKITFFFQLPSKRLSCPWQRLFWGLLFLEW